MRKVWSGRLQSGTAETVEAYTTSLAVDHRLYRDDIDGSLAHAAMLRRVGILTASEHRDIQRGLRAIRGELDAEAFLFESSDEDIHSAVERRLHEIAGAAAGKLHTGRSRNDQVATDLRRYAMRCCDQLVLAVAGLQEELVGRARDHRATLLPGYTHGQRAQVVSLAHHLLAYVEMFQRDIERLRDARGRSDVMPLGSGALAGSTLPLDREFVAQRLGFSRISANSMDAVSDRDFTVEITAACVLLMVHISRLCEDMVLWMSTEYGYAELPDTHATGSSLMPQKKNPDVLELARGRTGRCVGDLVALVTMLKGLPLTYNRDLQEDKVSFFDAVDTTASTLAILAEVVAVVHFNEERMARAASDPNLVATDVAEYLVGRGVPFREAHAMVGAAVHGADRRGRSIGDLTVAEWKSICGRVDDDFIDIFDPPTLLRRRELPGGPGPRAVSRQLTRAAAQIRATRRLAGRHPIPSRRR